MRKNKLLLLLALLMTAATGAWAQDAAKHVITATYDEQTRSLEQPLPYETTVGALYEAVTGEPFSSLISTFSTLGMPLTGISSGDPSVVSIGELNGASTPVTVKADGKATVGISFSGIYQYIYVSVVPPLYVTMADGTKDAAKWTATVGTSTNAKALPIGGLKGDGSETVTLKYTGRLKVKGVKATSDAAPAKEPVTLATPLTIEAITPGTIVVDIDGTLSKGMKYSVNGGTKTLITTTKSIEGLKAGDKVQFYGNGTQTQVYGGYTEVSILGIGDGFKTKVYGNIMSLLDEEGFATKTDLPNAQNVFYGLFKGNTTLNDASELLLPATTLAERCYFGMFTGCTSLTTAPKLPATTLAYQCYYSMFLSCTSLTNAYVKAAFTAGNAECESMFEDCSATGAVLHTTPDNKASWEAKMGSGKTWPNWTVADDWEAPAGNIVDLSTLTAAYEAQTLDILTGTTSQLITIAAGATVTLKDATVNNQIACSGTATIILADGSTNTVTAPSGKAGIQIGGEATETLTINAETAGTGILNATGGDEAAGIGTSMDETGGNIVINGGRVTATGGVHAAGIGTGDADNSANTCGAITINGGTVTAKGGEFAAGIGTGVAYSSNKNTCDAITINGGTVTATGGQNGAGIGTGLAFDATNECGAITIGTGVTSVTAKKSSSEPGPNSIGKGLSEGGTQTCGTITIGGTVKDQSEFTGATYTYTPSN